MKESNKKLNNDMWVYYHWVSIDFICDNNFIINDLIEDRINRCFNSKNK